MKGLLKFLSPFAPDQSGAVSVLYGLDGITVICDAGGCTGNICGFDEPRWFHKSTALFSAGLRDMDAILGRDDKLVAKLKDAAEHLDAPFAALIGTPVPAVIATDFKALTRMAEKRCKIPVIAVDCTGTRLYDQGAGDTYLALMKKFAGSRDGSLHQQAEKLPVTVFTANTGEIPMAQQMDQKSRLGILGVNPLDTSMLESEHILKEMYAGAYDQVLCYGTDGLESFALAPYVKKNLVLSPSGLKAARYLEKTYGTPYELAYPILKAELVDKLQGLAGKKVLIVDQQVKANEIRKTILATAGESAEAACAGSKAQVTVGTWFMLEKELSERCDVHFETEGEFADFVYGGEFDVIVGDPMLRRAVRKFDGEWISVAHFAISGVYEDEK